MKDSSENSQIVRYELNKYTRYKNVINQINKK